MTYQENTETSLIHESYMDVRDYECDMAGVVNNSVYLNYLEHARHTMLKAGGIDFADLARQHIGLVVTRAEVDYVRSLVSGNQFVVKTIIRRVSKLRFEFSQDIFRLPDNVPIIKAKIMGTPINAEGKPRIPSGLEALIVAMCSVHISD
ncbi:MAG: acyl-CoA thioesterase [Pseudomonadota bacterium]